VALGSTIQFSDSLFKYQFIGSTGFEYLGPAQTTPICFLGNARVLTPEGERRMDRMRVGDLVMTADGRSVAVQRIKMMTCEPGASTNPYVIPAGQWGATRDLPISPRHRVAVPGRGMVEARYLGLPQKAMAAPWTYYNLELPNWDTDNLVVQGVEVESLAPARTINVPAAVFKAFVRKHLGESPSAEALQKLFRKVRFNGDGTVNMLVFKKTQA
jgi:hypothetical protein